MKNIELPIKRGDRVWVKVYNERNGSFTSRMAEVISILQMCASGQMYRMQHYALLWTTAACGCIPWLNKSAKHATSSSLE
ncbi:MAG: hypothetical protein ACLSFW_24820 [Bacteroides cellulosilyticus]